MMAAIKTLLRAFALVLLISICASDVLVQLNVNRPLNDVSDKFVSFIVKPEDLYKALDGPQRKSLTRMAAMLGDSYVKFIGDYYFAAPPERPLNPSRIIWKGFNRWTRAVNWTMIIPVPYSTTSWEPMHALKILNNSHMVGITDCVWQLGTDFGSSRAQDYVNELKTFDLIVESFKPYVKDWQVMGADISAGSNPEETRRYVEISKDVNAAFGWTQPIESMPSSISGSYINENDLALKMLLNKKVPVWLTLPPRNQKNKKSKSSNKSSNDDNIDALRWAQTMGEAASTGFDVIFKHISLADLSEPNFSFYVTTLFKKVMGSRVFPARPLSLMIRSNKLYTHCANDVSGGIAFMLVNADEKPLHLSIRSMTKIAETEVWQYTLTSRKANVYLNNEKMSINSTITPMVSVKEKDQFVQLSTPGRSVSFWVLPNVDLEHCQYTEIGADELDTQSEEKVVKKHYSSTDKLVQDLIRETTIPKGILASVINRARRNAMFRPKRFILEGEPDSFKGFKKLFAIDEEAEEEEKEKPIYKRENNLEGEEKTLGFMQWIRKLIEQSLSEDSPLLRRGRRSADNYLGSFLSTRDSKRKAVTRKITEIRKPENEMQPLFDLEDFNEEEFFKKIDEYKPPAYVRLPEGDVHLKYITNLDGDDVDYYDEEQRKNNRRAQQNQARGKEAKNEMKPLRLLPTEYYEAVPVINKKPLEPRHSFGAALNSFLFPEPFAKKTIKDLKKDKQKLQEKEIKTEIRLLKDTSSQENKKEKIPRFFSTKNHLKNVLTNDSEMKASKEEQDEEKQPTKRRTDDYNRSRNDKKMEMRKHKFDFLNENSDHSFNEHEDEEESSKMSKEDKNELSEMPWWDLSAATKQRSRRDLSMELAGEAWNANLITKADVLSPLGDINPEDLALYEYHVDTVTKKNGGNDILDIEQIMKKEDYCNTDENEDENKENTQNNSFIATMKKKVSSFMDMVSRNLSHLYHSFTKHMEGACTENTTPDSISAVPITPVSSSRVDK